MDFKETECGDVDWTGVVQGRDKLRALLNKAITLRILYNGGNCLTVSGNGNFSKRTVFYGGRWLVH